jgi:hypothetical protein
MSRRKITRTDILSIDEYEKVRGERRKSIAELKRNRRVSVGPDVTFYFESFDTMWHQIHEMLRIEKGGEAQIDDELQAYNPLIPDGTNLVATMMIEIDDPVRRDKVLRGLGGIESTVSLVVADETVGAVPETDVERTKADGKTSSIHFLKFPFSRAQIDAFRRHQSRVVLAIAHPRYDHMAALPKEVVSALAADFD